MMNKKARLGLIASALAAGGLFFWWTSVRPSAAELPKPKGYFEIALPDTSSVAFEARDGFRVDFRTNKSAVWKTVNADKGWGTVSFPKLGAEIQLSYVAVGDQLPKLLDDAHQLAFKHDVVAQGIKEKFGSRAPGTRYFIPIPRQYGYAVSIFHHGQHQPFPARVRLRTGQAQCRLPSARKRLLASRSHPFDGDGTLEGWEMKG
jgi:hypothetical protein